MDTTSGYALNEAILHVDMTGVTQPVTMTFYHYNNGDENEFDGLSVGSTFTGHRNADLVAVSNDGGATWNVVSLLGGSGTLAVTLDPATTAQSSDFQVKFQQYDNLPWNSDGRAFDDVRLFFGYAAWAADAGLAGADAQLSADPDGDGLSNDLEYAYRLDPTVPDSGVILAPGETRGAPRLAIEQDLNAQRLSITYLRARHRGDVSYYPEFANGLEASDWEVSTNAEITTPIDADWEQVQIRDHVTSAETDRRFARLKIVVEQ